MAVTRNDVARAAGVSSAVVSYVLNDGPRPVSAGTRQRVLDAIDQLGYRRDLVARSMRTGTTNSVGLVLPDITLSYFAVMTQRITEIARGKGLTIIVATSNGSVEVEREHLADLADRRVDGVILMSVDPLQELSWAGDFGLPVLVVDRPVVAVDGTATATAHLLDHGVKTLARVAGPERFATTRRRDAGWNRALREHGLDEANYPVVRAEVSEPGGYDAAIRLLTSDRRPDGVVADSAPQAMGVLRAAADLGVDVPGDLSVIACEVGDQGDFTVPRLSSVDSPIDQIANQAVELIRSTERRSQLLTLSGTAFTLHVRESCGHTG